MFVEPIGFSYSAAEVYPFDGAFEVAFGYIDEKLRWSCFAVGYKVDDSEGINNKCTPIGKQLVDSRSAAQFFIFGECKVVHRF